MTEPAIIIRGLKVRLADRLILAGADLTVAPGEMVALMGISGSGKSTLLRAAVGLTPPEEGEVKLLGENLIGATSARLREIRQKVGMLFQGNALFDSMTVADNIGFILREVMELPPAEIDRRVRELLDRLQLGDIGALYPSALSGGMKKRVGIARAVAHNPPVMFYDDPTAGLDPVTSLVIAELIARIGREREQSGVVATNYLPLILKVAHRAVLLRDGKIMEIGPTSSLQSADVSELGLDGEREAAP